TTVAPCWANPRAMARPIPRLPPETNTICPETSNRLRALGSVTRSDIHRNSQRQVTNTKVQITPCHLPAPNPRRRNTMDDFRLTLASNIGSPKPANHHSLTHFPPDKTTNSLLK